MALTPEQFNLLATKDDLKDELGKMEDRIMEKFDAVLTCVDKMSKAEDTCATELAANIAAHTRFQESIDDHETRMSTLETKGVAA